MSGLVTGLQNRARRFESARHLQKSSRRKTKWFSSYLIFSLITRLATSSATTIAPCR